MKSLALNGMLILLMSCGDKTDPDADMDADGIKAAIDCDDNDPSLQAIGLDADCDGILTDDDCDDNDATQPLLDTDCDGVLTTEDCDDNDIDNTFNSTTDADCDGIVTAEDCDDNDPFLRAILLDADCDGHQSDFDCDDANPDINSNSEDPTTDGIDQNCDGIDGLWYEAEPDGFGIFISGMQSCQHFTLTDQWTNDLVEQVKSDISGFIDVDEITYQPPHGCLHKLSLPNGKCKSLYEEKPLYTYGGTSEDNCEAAGGEWFPYTD